MTVFLVGAGPGDPGLITLRGAEVLRRADVVVHDRLAAPSLLDLAPPAAVRIDVGKRPGAPIAQDEINAVLVEHARRGETVVRLKGGDPYVFGRGGEEAAALLAAGVPFEVVPGITSAVAVPAYAGIPLTHRGLSASFTVVTGHRGHDQDGDTDWETLARAGGTIVVLMGVAHRAEIAERLVAAGRAADTPVAAIHRGTTWEHTTVRTTLAGLAATPMEPPVTMVIGPVASLDLSWFERRPLLGRRIAVTRARAQAGVLSAALESMGASAVTVPTIDIADPDDDGRALQEAASCAGTFDWVVFASANAVDRFMRCVRDARALGPARVAAIGPGTTAALRAHGIVADAIARDALAESLVEAVGAPGSSFTGGAAPNDAAASGRVLVPRAAAGRDVLIDGLRAAGWRVEAVDAYRTVAVPVAAPQRAQLRSADAIAFTSSSTVAHLVDGLGGDLDDVPRVVACIGPVTARTAAEAGMEVAVVADPHTTAGLVDALARVFGQPNRP